MEEATKTPRELVDAYEAQTLGTGSYWETSRPTECLYTDGIRFLADTCEAHWLIDLIVSHQGQIYAKHGELCRFQVWRFTKHETGDGWTFAAWSDTPNSPDSTLLASQDVLHSDFDPSMDGFEVWLDHSVLCLKAER